MTRREYLTALNQYLVTMSESEKTAILKEYDEQYRRGFEAGKTEAQVSASLGSPYDAANELLAGRRPKFPTYPPKPRPQTAQTSAQTSHSAQQPQSSVHRSADGYQQPVQQRTPSYSAPTYPTQPQQPTYSAPAYPTQPQQPSYSAPAYPTQPQQPAYSAPAETQYPPRPRSSQAYVDYDRAAEEEPLPEKKKRSSNYSVTGIIVVAVLGVILVPTLGFALYYLVRGLYELIRAFPGTGIALIAAGGSFSADSLWICLGLICIGVSFLALTGLLVMAIIEITKLFIKLFRYTYKECKKMIKEGSF